MNIQKLLTDEISRAEALFKNINMKSLSDRINFAKSRDQQPVLNVPQFNHLRIFGRGNDLVVDPATSDDDSGPENTRPTLADVADAICDSKMLVFSKKYTPVPY